MNKAQRKEKNQRIASELKRLGIERRQARCPICNRVYHADMLKGGFLTHRCNK